MKLKDEQKLNSHFPSYGDQFFYYKENVLMLRDYANIIKKTIIKYNKLNILSLGIGHRIVCNEILRFINSESHYTILEGSTAIIKQIEGLSVFNQNVKIQHTYFEDYLPGNKFDIIEMGFVLEHVAVPLQLMEKYKEYLAENGRIFAAVPNARSLHRLIGQKAGLLDDLYRLSDSDKQLGHQRYFDCDSFVDLMMKAGFKIEKIEGLYLKPFTTSQLSSLNLSVDINNALCLCAKELPEISNGIVIEASL